MRAEFELKQLRTQYLDAFVDRAPKRTLDVVAHMLFELDRLDRVLDVGLHYLAERLKAGRVDVGFGNATDRHFAPVRQVRLHDELPSLIGLRLPNKHEVLQRVWRRTEPVAYDRVLASDDLGTLKASFVETGAKAMLAQSLRASGRAFGIVCVDEMQHHRKWSSNDKAILSSFTDSFFGPIVGISRAHTASRDANKPSPAELDAIRLAACGQSYKEIAHSLGKSLRTVEFQLRSARRKVGAANQAELVRRCQIWL